MQKNALVWRWALQLASTDGTSSPLYQNHLCQAVKWIKLFSPLYEKPLTNQRRGWVHSGQGLHGWVKALRPVLHKGERLVHSFILVPRNKALECWSCVKITHTHSNKTPKQAIKTVNVCHEFAWKSKDSLSETGAAGEFAVRFRKDILYRTIPFSCEILSSTSRKNEL